LGNDVRLIATVGDDVVRSLLERQVLAPEVPADIHQFHGVERAAPPPGSTGGVRALSFEGIEHRNETGHVSPIAPRHAHVVADVDEHGDVHVLEQSGADEIRLRPDQLLGRAGPDSDGSRELFALHDLFHGDGGGDVQRLAGVVSFAVTGGALDDRIVVRDARFLGGLRNPVDVGA
jgi:hypothetical protein